MKPVGATPSQAVKLRVLAKATRRAKGKSLAARVARVLTEPLSPRTDQLSATVIVATASTWVSCQWGPGITVTCAAAMPGLHLFRSKYSPDSNHHLRECQHTGKPEHGHFCPEVPATLKNGSKREPTTRVSTEPNSGKKQKPMTALELTSHTGKSECHGK